MDIKFKTGGSAKTAGGGFAAVFQGLRGMAQSAPPPRLYPEIERFIARYLELAEAATDDDAEEAQKYATRTAVLLYHMASQAATEELMRICLNGLARMGHYGRILAACMLACGRIPLADARECIEALPMPERIDLCDKLLSDADRLDPDLRALGQDLLEGVMEGDMNDYQFYLEGRAGFYPPPAFALGEAVARGPLGEKCRAVAKKPKSMGELNEWAHLAASMHAEDLAQDFLPHLAAAGSLAIDDILKTVLLLEDPPPLAAKHLVSLLPSSDLDTRLAAMEGLIAMGSPHLGKLCAKVYDKLEDLRPGLVARLPRLPYQELEFFFKALPEKERAPIFLALYVLLAQADPANAEESLLLAKAKFKAAHKKPPDSKSVAMLKSLIAEQQATEVPEPRSAAPKKVAREAKNDSGGLLGGLFGKGSKKAPPAKTATLASKSEFTQSTLEGKTFANTVLTGKDFTGSFVSGSSFTNVGAANARFKGCVFKDCAFKRVRFANCDFSEAAFHGCTFEDVRFDSCLVDSTVFHQCVCMLLCVQNSTMHESMLVKCSLSSSRLAGVDFSYALLEDTAFSGVEVEDCLFAHARLARLSCDNGTVSATLFQGCRVTGAGCNPPHLLELRRQNMLAALNQMGSEPLDLPKAGKTGLELAKYAVCFWFNRKDSLDRLSAFYANDIRRENWGFKKLGKKKSDLYNILPLLLHTDAFDRDRGLYPAVPPCRITGYVPTYSTVMTARHYFPGQDFITEPSESLEIDGLFTIGSMGTVAQGEDSDIDYWVCAQLSEISEADIDGLSQKLEMLTEWAEEFFELEAYFFLMDIEDVRVNNFGFSDKESSGSAQALMLKEEFYRTAGWVAGKFPIWWLVPPGTNKRQYESIKKSVLRQFGADRMVDLGHVHQIPAEEFFGASLWQIVKGLKSPFKSIMKFGLLARYTKEVDAGLLCDKIKGNILARKRDLWNIDPYVSMFREIMTFYGAQKDNEALSLITLSFFLKAKLHAAVSNLKIPLTRHEKGILSLFTRVLTNSGLGEDLTTPPSRMSFNKLLKLGTRVNQFMIKTYLNVRDLQSDGVQAAISPEDLTKLGRKIVSTFARRQFKVERMPFLKMKESLFTELFVTVKQDKKNRYWDLQGGLMDEASGRSNISDLRRGMALAPLVCWAAANHLFKPEMQIKTDMTTMPVMAQDVRELLIALTGFFKDKDTFDTDVSENLKPERLTRAFFILNMTAPRDADQILEIWLVYSTNWGEMFCRKQAPDETLQVDPISYLKKHLEVEVPDDAPIDLFIPSRSQCPGILLI